MRIAAIALTLKIARRMGLRPWSPQARSLMQLILSTASRTLDDPGTKLNKHQKVLRAARRLAESQSARQPIADALEVSMLSAWTFQRDLSAWLRGTAAEAAGMKAGCPTRA
jgi:hypothetical protein